VVERFRRTLGGFDPRQVRAALEERDLRLERLEREAQQLARRVLETEKRAKGGRGGGEADTGNVAALGRRLEEIHDQARRQATRIRMGALQDAVQIADRVTELSKLRDELGQRVADLAETAGIRPGAADRPPVGTEAAAATHDGIYAGRIEVEVGPLRDFAQLTRFEDAASAIDPSADVAVSNFSDGRATFSMNFAQPVELVRELEQRAPFSFQVRDTRPDGLVIDIDADAHHAA
jgi:hypothetical protein